MSGNDQKGGRSAAIAAAVILLVTGLAFFVLPDVMIALGKISPWLAAAVGAGLVLAFFLLFWLRARYQRGRE
jgi:phosphotransferase system  glucose/maltose/N-acetylglucosamine-specific IIC component